MRREDILRMIDILRAELQQSESRFNYDGILSCGKCQRQINVALPLEIPAYTPYTLTCRNCDHELIRPLTWEEIANLRYGEQSP